MKHKKVSENKDKKSFIYRIQSVENPLWLNYYPDFDGYYLSIPNDVAEAINKEIAEVINPKYKIEISSEHASASISVKLYELKEKVGDKKVRISDCVLKFNEYTFGKKIGLSKTLLEAKLSDRKSSYMEADDFFDDVEDEAVANDFEVENKESSDLPF